MNGLSKSKAFKFFKTYSRVIMAVSVLAITLSVFCFKYYSTVRETIYDESERYLQEISLRTVNNIERILNDNYSILNTMAISIENIETKSFENIQSLLKKQRDSSELSEFKSIYLLDSTGKSYDLNNKEVFISFDSNILDNMLAAKRTMSPSQVINNTEFITFSVPVNNLYVDNKQIVALIGSYSQDTFNQTLSMSSFDSKAYSQLISRNGTVVVRSSYLGSIKTGYNIFNSLSKASFDNNNSIDHLIEDISLDKSGQLSFRLEDEHLYMTYTPITGEDWFLITFIPVQVVNQKSDLLLTSTISISGIVTFIFVMLCSALIFVFNSNRKTLETMAYVDLVTGGNTMQRFYKLTDTILTAHPGKSFAILYSNIENFKVMNEQLGRHNCDIILKSYDNYISSMLGNNECISRLYADNFCILIEYTDDEAMLTRFNEWYDYAHSFVSSGEMLWSVPITKYGIYVFTKYNIPIPQMIDRAKLALKEQTWHMDSKIPYSYYNDNLRQKLLREKQLEDWMHLAIQNDEFRVFLQPKYHLPDESIKGAEALVRWARPEEGMIFPDEFIPLFEKNGFVVRLDLWVFEEVCKTMSRWISEGKEPIVTSVNCSKIHFRNINFLNEYIRISNIYKIDRRLIEIELTESVVFENSDDLIKIITKIKDAGFSCSIDDFGSGYSSLNLLQTIPVDTLKLDRIFFNNTLTTISRNKAIIRTILLMAKELNMLTVAEGVEHRSQVEMLKEIGCDFIQGYVYAKPMPISDFEKLAF